MMDGKMIEMRLAHLNMIQSIIGRMSQFSAGVKNFCVTVIAAVVTVSFQRETPMLMWAALAVGLIFGLMDAYYLAQERRYRKLYESVAGRQLDDAGQLSLKAPSLKLSTYFDAVVSVSVAGFYVLLLIGTAALLSISNNVWTRF